MTNEYGPIFTLWLVRHIFRLPNLRSTVFRTLFGQGSKPLFVVGTFEAANDILERRGAAATADRPRSIMAGEVLSRSSFR
jgi:hypothetical protein